MIGATALREDARDVGFLDGRAARRHAREVDAARLRQRPRLGGGGDRRGQAVAARCRGHVGLAGARERRRIVAHIGERRIDRDPGAGVDRVKEQASGAGDELGGRLLGLDLGDRLAGGDLRAVEREPAGQGHGVVVLVEAGRTQDPGVIRQDRLLRAWALSGPQCISHLAPHQKIGQGCHTLLVAK